MSLELARSLLSYDPATGALSWKRSPRRGVSIGPAGCVNPDGYKIVGYNGRLYMGIHLIWFLQTGQWPKHGVDHKNRCSSDDRWENLREATYGQNNQNMSLRKDSRTGVRGVGFNNKSGKFCARIRKDGKTHWLGYFDALDEATAVRHAAELKHFGEFSPLHGGIS